MSILEQNQLPTEISTPGFIEAGILIIGGIVIICMILIETHYENQSKKIKIAKKE